jgi:hypothetical protein
MEFQMLKDSIPLLTDTGTEWEIIGNKIRADGWYGQRDGLHTVTIKTKRLKGRLYLEATLANEPTEQDWFPIHLVSDKPYIEYPFNSMAPNDGTGDTRTNAFTFIGQFTFIRARLDRKHLTYPGTPGQVQVFGKISEILLTH